MNLGRVSKYDRLAERFSESSYANLAFYMERRLVIATNWGQPLLPGDSVLELGCGDGYLARFFADHGLRYHGVDISQRMADVAKRRLTDAGLDGDVRVMDVSEMTFSEPYDAVISYMRAFFTYVPEPLRFLQQIRPYVRKKLIVDLDPRRTIPLRAAIEILRKAGFRNICWRPFLVPETQKLPEAVLRMLAMCEIIPFVRSLPIRWKFHVLLMGEPCSGNPLD